MIGRLVKAAEEQSDGIKTLRDRVETLEREVSACSLAETLA